MPTQNVNLSTHQSKFIQQRVRSGRYQNASEVVRAGLRLLEQKEAEDGLRLEALKRLTAEAFESLDRGEHQTFDEASLDLYRQEASRPSTKPTRKSGKRRAV
jgi:antitoxin ParD1/3/4